jgi:hypothetical protein
VHQRQWNHNSWKNSYHAADREGEQVLHGPRPGDHEKDEAETHRMKAQHKRQYTH